MVSYLLLSSKTKKVLERIKVFILFVWLIAYSSLGVNAQSYLRYMVINGDTVPVYDLPTVEVGGPDYTKPPVFKNRRQSKEYNRLRAYVKKVYPYAKLASQKLRECEDEIRRDPESKKKAMKNVEKALRKKYGKALKSLTVSQGKLLLLLIDRETGFTTFELVRELRGSFNASMYQGLAVLFGHSLKLNYEPRGKHWMIEDIVQKIELGIL